MKPATPANAIWASDVWPAKPVITTNDSAITVAITVVMIAPRHSGPRARRPATASDNGTSTETGVTLAGGTAGSLKSSTAPRSGNRSPNTTIAMMMIRNGSPSRAPYSGNQLRSTWSLVNVDCAIPIANPVITVGTT